MRRAQWLLALTPFAPIASAELFHSFPWSVAQPGGDFAVDLIVSSSPGKQWNALILTVRAFGGVTILSPPDNLPLGAWTPPVPDEGATYDTYVRSPSADAVPLLAAPRTRSLR